MADTDKTDGEYTREDFAKAAEEAFADDEVSGFASDPTQKWGRVGVRFLDNLGKLSGGVPTPGCCTQGCCGDGGFKV